MAEPMRRETDEQRRRRELAAGEEHAAQVARDPEMTRRITETQARINAHGFDENDVIPYETMLAATVPGTDVSVSDGVHLQARAVWLIEVADLA